MARSSRQACRRAQGLSKHEQLQSSALATVDNWATSAIEARAGRSDSHLPCRPGLFPAIGIYFTTRIIAKNEGAELRTRPSIERCARARAGSGSAKRKQCSLPADHQSHEHVVARVGADGDAEASPVIHPGEYTPARVRTEHIAWNGSPLGPCCAPGERRAEPRRLGLCQPTGISAGERRDQAPKSRGEIASPHTRRRCSGRVVPESVPNRWRTLC